MTTFFLAEKMPKMPKFKDLFSNYGVTDTWKSTHKYEFVIKQSLKKYLVRNLGMYLDQSRCPAV